MPGELEVVPYALVERRTLDDRFKDPVRRGRVAVRGAGGGEGAEGEGGEGRVGGREGLAVVFFEEGRVDAEVETGGAAGE